MKNLKMVLVLGLVFVMAASLLYGCAPKTTTEEATSPETSAATTDETAAADETTTTDETSAAPAESDPNHEVYTMDNRVPWSGVTSPVVVSREDVDKAISADNTKDSVTVGYATWTVGTPFFAAMMDTVKAECEKHGYEIITAVSDGDVNKQVANIENFITMGVDVIIDNAYSVEAEAAVIEQAVDAGIPVIGLGLPFAESTPVITTAATNYYGQGFMVGMLAAQVYEGVEVKAATLPGMIGHTIAESKLNGFLGGFVYQRAIELGIPFDTKEDAMLYGYNLEQEIVKNASFSDSDMMFDVVASIDGYWSQDGGLTAMEDILTAHPEVNLVFTDNDQEGFGAIKAMQNAGYKVGEEIKIVSPGDGTKEALQLIEDGTYLGITLASPYTWSKACTDLVYMIFNEGFDATNLPSCSYLEDVLVTQDNVADWMTEDEFTTLPDQVYAPIS